jgi:transcriptional regulator with XRE-family HTH domain
MYIIGMESKTNNNIGRLIKQRRVTIPLTLYELSVDSGVSSSHIGRIERGDRFPSARILRKIAKPLGFGEEELFVLAGFLSDSSSEQENSGNYNHQILKLDPRVANLLACEPVEVQRAVIGILSLLKSIAQTGKLLKNK